MSKKETEDIDPRILEICQRLKELRIQRGWSSHEAFALSHDMSRQSYWKLEKGKNITLKTLFRVLDCHNITLEEFFLNELMNNTLKQDK